MLKKKEKAKNCNWYPNQNQDQKEKLGYFRRKHRKNDQNSLLVHVFYWWNIGHRPITARVSSTSVSDEKWFLVLFSLSLVPLYLFYLARWKTRGRGPGIRVSGSRVAGCGKHGVWKARGLVENTGFKWKTRGLSEKHGETFFRQNINFPH